MGAGLLSRLNLVPSGLAPRASAALSFGEMMLMTTSQTLLPLYKC